MAWNVIIANINGSNPVTLSGLSKPWPRNPTPTYTRSLSEHKMVAGWDGSSVIPGETVYQDFGSTKSSGKWEISFHAQAATVAALETKFFTASSMRLSTDNNVTIWEVVWDTGESFLVEPVEGFDGEETATMWYKVTLRLNTVRQLV